MFAVESRYAEALISVAPSPEIANSMELTMREFSDAMSYGSELRSFMLNPTISTAIKKETVQKILSEDAEAILLDFFYLLIDKNRMANLPGICREYKRLKDLRQNNIDVHVYSAQPVGQAQLLEISEKYRKRYGSATAQVYYHLDPALLGSIRIQIGDIRIDDTLYGRLDSLRSILVGS